MSTTEPAWLPLVRELLEQLEGFESNAYPDPKTGGAPWTIGHGNTFYEDGSPVRRGDTISRSAADALRDHHLRATAAGLAKLLKHWPSYRATEQAGLVSWAYNVGLGAVESSTLRRRLNYGNPLQEVASVELPRWNDPGSNVEEGQTKRRRIELAMIRRGLTPWQAGNIKHVTPRMIGPTFTPHQFGFKDGDFHLIVNDINETLKAYSSDGKELFRIPCLARGQGLDTDWHTRGSDTPPGLYKLGRLYDDILAHGEHPNYSNDQMLSYGWQSYDMISLDGNEERAGRAGIMLHGGGSNCGWPGAWAPRQRLYPTLGCVRIYNIDLRNRIQPLYNMGTVFMSVYQEG